MRLGVLVAGEGVGALGAIGVLRALERKGVRAHAVCGVGAGAYMAALWACGMSAQEMAEKAGEAAALGARLADRDPLAGLSRRAGALYRGKNAARLIFRQTQGRALQACTRPAAFLCMAIPARRTLVFSPVQGESADSVWTDHAPVWFAARAALGGPPLLRPASFIGVPICAHPDLRECVRVLHALDASVIAAVYPVYARGIPATPADVPAWEGTLCVRRALYGIRQIPIELPDYVRPLGWEEIPACLRAGERAGAQADIRHWAEEDGKMILLYP
jgi:hypothetical protein